MPDLHSALRPRPPRRHPRAPHRRLLNVSRHPIGERAAGLEPGDFILVHSYGEFAPRLIGFGQRLHHPPEFAYWTHAAFYVGAREDPDFGEFEALIEAKGRHPVRFVPLSQYDARDYAAVRLGPASLVSSEVQMRTNAVGYARSQLGHGYGYLTIVTLAAWSLFGGRVTVGVSGENVCSGLVASALTRLGELFDGDPITQMPADLARKYGAKR